jgi:uncharacterized SAM-binding protein YcdF (DUF218 family)
MSKAKKQASGNTPFFTRQNYIWMLIGLFILGIGFYLMGGGKSTDPKVFNTAEVYSTTRITVAPLLIILGFIIEIYAIMKNPGSASE